MSKERIRKPYLTWTDVCINDAISLVCPELNLYKFRHSQLVELVEYSKQND